MVDTKRTDAPLFRALEPRIMLDAAALSDATTALAESTDLEVTLATDETADEERRPAEDGADSGVASGQESGITDQEAADPVPDSTTADQSENGQSAVPDLVGSLAQESAGETDENVIDESVDAATEPTEAVDGIGAETDQEILPEARTPTIKEAEESAVVEEPVLMHAAEPEEVVAESVADELDGTAALETVTTADTDTSGDALAPPVPVSNDSESEAGEVVVDESVDAATEPVEAVDGIGAETDQEILPEARTTTIKGAAESAVVEESVLTHAADPEDVVSESVAGGLDGIAAPETVATVDIDASEDVLPTPAPASNESEIEAGEVVVDDGVDAVIEPTEESADLEKTANELLAATSLSGDPDKREIVFIDSQVEGYEALAQAARQRTAEVYLIKAGEDGYQRMAEVLSGESGIDAIHVLGHGSSAEATLGAASLNPDTTEEYARELTVIGEALTDAGDLLLYGCYVGEGGSGELFISQVASLTGADVAASNDLTGSEELGGDWELEYDTGVIDVPTLRALGFDSTLSLEYDDLRTWTAEGDVRALNDDDGDGSTWDVIDGGRSVVQDLNGNQMYFVSSSSEIDVAIQGTMKTTDSDDDDMGFVLGYQDPNNHVLFRWSDAGINPDKPRELAFVKNGSPTTLASDGIRWNQGTEYEFKALYMQDSIRVEIDGATVFDVTSSDLTNAGVSLSAGAYGFYNLSQGGVTYGNIRSAPGSTTAVVPTPADDSYGTDEGIDLTKDRFTGILSNDYDANLDIYNILIDGVELTSDASSHTVNGSYGKLTVNGDGSFSYDTDPTGTGTDTFSYQLKDVDGTSQAATIDISVLEPNVAPTDITLNNSSILSRATDAIVADISVTDQNASDSHDITIESQSVSGMFKVVDGQIRVADGSGIGLDNASYTLDLKATDLRGLSYSETVTLTESINDAPTISGLPASVSVTEDVARNVDLSAVTFGDPDSGTNDIDLSLIAGTGTLTANDAGGVVVSGSATNSITLTGTASEIDSFLNTASNIQYTGALNSNGNSADMISVSSDDGGNSGDGGGGPTALGTVNVNITAVDDPTTIASGTPGVGFTEGGGPVAVAPNLTVNDPDAVAATTAKVTISNHQIGDSLGFLPGGGDVGGISGNYNVNTETLTLTDTANSSAAQWQTALRSVVMDSTSEHPDTQTRNVEIVLGDKLSLTFDADGDGTAENHYYEYVADSGVDWDDAKDAAEDRTFNGLPGYLATITSLGENDLIAGKLGGDAWIGASDAERTWTASDGSTFTTTEGQWTWVTGPEAGVQFWAEDPDNTDAETEDFPGSTVDGRYANWSSGEPNDYRGNEDYAHLYASDGEWNDFPETTSVAGYVVEYSNTDASGGTAFSTVASVSVAQANDAPTLTAGATLAPVSEDALNPVGETVSSLIGGAFDDVDSSDALAGIAISADGATSAEGAWEYSTDSGTNWHQIGSVAADSALLLDKTALLRFKPAQDFNGSPGGLSVHVVDDSSSLAFSSGGARETFDTTADDSTSEVAASTETIGIDITPVNDAPVADSASLSLSDSSTSADLQAETTGTLTGTDVDGDALTFGIDDSGTRVTSAVAGNYGSLQVNDDGTYVYTPDNEALSGVEGSVTDVFTLHVSDGSLSDTSASLTVNLSGAADSAVPYDEQAIAQQLFANTVISTDGDGVELSYGGGYLRVSPGVEDTDATLSLTRVDTADTASGVISIVGNAVYLGDGTDAEVIGVLDSVENGENGKALRINFEVDFANGEFAADTTGLLTGTTGEVVAIEGWEIVNDRVILARDNQTPGDAIDGRPTPVDTTYPSQNTGRNLFDRGSLRSFTFESYVSSLNSTASNTTDDGLNTLAQPADNDRSLQLYSTMWSNSGYEVIRGPYVYSTGSVGLEAGDKVQFDWRALGGGDAYDVFGYIVNVDESIDRTDPDKFQIILDDTGQTTTTSTNWRSEVVEVAAGGEYQFVFLSGTFDRTGGRLLGAQLYIDNVVVEQSGGGAAIGDDAVQGLARQVVYENSSDQSSDQGIIGKTFTLSVQGSDETENDTTLSVSQSLDLQEINDPVTLSSLDTIYYTDTQAPDETFVTATGQALASDPDTDTTFSFGTTGGTSAGGIQTKAGDYGSLELNETTGAYTYTPDSDSINALSESRTESFEITATDGDGSTASQTLTVDIQAVNDAALFGGPASTQGFTENGSAQLIDPSITISDPEASDYSGGYLTFDIQTNRDADDQLVIQSTGGISVSGNTVFAGGTQIGIIDADADGSSGKALRIDLTSNAFSSQVEALARAIAFQNDADDLSAADRGIQIELNDGGVDGSGTPRASFKSAAIEVTTINDLPEITLSDASYEVEKDVDTNARGELAITGISFEDVDLTGDITVTLKSVMNDGSDATYGFYSVKTDVVGGLAAGDITNNNGAAVTLTGTLDEINTTLAATEGLLFNADQTGNLGNDFVTPGPVYLQATAEDDAGGIAQRKALVLVMPAVPNADSDNIVADEDSVVRVNIESLVSDINNAGGVYTFGDGTPDDKDGNGGNIGSSYSFITDDLDADGTDENVGLELPNGQLILTQNAVMGGNNANFLYIPDENFNGVEQFVYQYDSNDGTGSNDTLSDIAQISIFVRPVNDAPVLTAISNSETVDEDSPLVFNTDNGNALTLSDVDAGPVDPLELSLSVASGSLTLATSDGLSITAGADGSGSMTVRGASGDLRSALDGLQYKGGRDFEGADALTLSLNDLGFSGSGGSQASGQTVDIDLVPVNDAPVVSATPGQGYDEADDASQQSLSLTGTVSIQDVDAGERGDVSSTLSSLSATNGGINTALQTAMAASNALNISETDILPQSLGWTFSVPAADFDFLAAGEVLTAEYTISVEDKAASATNPSNDARLTATDTVSITVTGTNDDPVITAGTVTSSLAETNSGLSSSGSFSVEDLDLSDEVTVDAVVSVSGDSDVARPSNAEFLGMLSYTKTPISSSATTGTVSWSFDTGADGLDYLAAGEKLTLEYTLTATDAEGSTAQQNVTVSITGTNDTPVIRAINGSAQINETNAGLSARGSFAVSDVDTSDQINASVGSLTVGGTSDRGDVAAPSDTALSRMLTLDNPAVVGGSANEGTLTWSFDSAGESFDYLAAGETLTLTYDLAISDSEGSQSADQVVVTITGTNDAPVIRGSIADTSLSFSQAYVQTTGELFTDVDPDGNWQYQATGLPTGLSINSSTGEIVGQAIQSGEFTVIVTATDAAGASNQVEYNLSVAPPPLPASDSADIIEGTGDVGGPGESGDNARPTSAGGNNGGGLGLDMTGGSGNPVVPMSGRAVLDSASQGGATLLGIANDIGVGVMGLSGGDAGPAPNSASIASPSGIAGGSTVANTGGADGSASGGDGTVVNAEITTGSATQGGQSTANGEAGAGVTDAPISVAVNVGEDGTVEVQADSEADIDAEGVAGLQVLSGDAEQRVIFRVEDGARLAETVYTGRIAGGDPLPPGLSVDRSTGDLVGELPPGESLVIEVIAQDPDGTERRIQVRIGEDASQSGRGEQMDGGPDTESVSTDGEIGYSVELDHGLLAFTRQIEALAERESSYGDRLVAAL